MQNLKDKLYNYEVTPPKQNWNLIAGKLKADKIENQFPAKKISRRFYYGLSAAAAAAIIVFSLIFWVDNINKKSNKNSVVSSANSNDEDNIGINNNLDGDDKITIPTSTPEGTAVKKKDKFKNQIALSVSKKYITINGPQGKPVKISSKAATLIVSSDDQNLSKPIWNDKVNKWKDIMKANILAPTTGNFLDIVGLTQALKEQDTP